MLGNNLRYLFRDYFEESKIFVAPNGVDLIIPEAGKRDQLRVLYLSNLSRAKGVNTFIESVALMKEMSNNIIFTLAGEWYDDEAEEYCTRLIKELGPEGFILQSGCDIPANAKLENVQAMVAAARES